jgi:hypothetical protein
MGSARLYGFLASVVRVASVLATLFILAGFLGYLTDVVRDTSKVNAAGVPAPAAAPIPTLTIDISEPDPSPAVEQVRQSEHTAAREVIDDVGDALAAPFTWIAADSRTWVRRVLYSVLGLLLYGLGGHILADRLRRLSDDARRRAVRERQAAEAAQRRASGNYVSPA